MKVIPVINCPNFGCVREKVEIAKAFLEEGHFLHLDVADGAFTFHKTWGNPAEWAGLRAPFALEVHLMVERPEQYIERWLAAGAKRFIVHVETLERNSFEWILQECKRHGAEVMLASNPETPVKKLEPYLKRCAAFQVLSVDPGPAGQKFLPLTLEKVKFLRRKMPDATIEVDGGMVPATARRAGSAGADVVVSGSYIFGSGDPTAAYDELVRLRAPRSRWYRESVAPRARSSSVRSMESLTEKKLEELELMATRLRADVN